MIAVHIARLGFIGLLKPAPGSWGSLTAVLVWWLLLYNVPSHWYAIICIALIVISIWSSGETERVLRKADPGSVVIDEFVAMIIALYVTPREVLPAIVAFFLFRFFDILKPFYIRKLEKFKGGLGITLDDLGAAVYTMIMMLVFRSLNVF